jgi:hypothetical protein
MFDNMIDAKENTQKQACTCPNIVHTNFSKNKLALIRKKNDLQRNNAYVGQKATGTTNINEEMT